MMRQATGYLSIETKGKGLVDITAAVARWCEDEAMAEGLLTLLSQNGEASLTVQEDAKGYELRHALASLKPPAPRRRGIEIGDHFARLSSGDRPPYLHTLLGGVHLSVPLIGGGLALGRRQKICLWEHDPNIQERRIALHLIGA